MKKINLTNGVFIDLIQTDESFAAYDVFINDAKEHSKNKKFNSFVIDYKNQIKTNENAIKKLAALEQVILQYKAVTHDFEVKFSIVKDYIYARTHFFRSHSKTRELRVIVDKTDFHPDGDYENNQELVKKGKEKLLEAMNQELANSIKNYESFS